MIRHSALKFLSLAALLLVTACGTGAPETESEEALIERARGIHERVITLDTHDDINVSNFTEEQNYTMNLSTQVTLPKMREGGLDVAWLVVYTGQGDLTDEGYAAAYENAMSKFDAIHWLTGEKAPDQIGLALTSDDVRRLVGEGKLVAMIGVENAYPLGLNLDNIRLFHERGARYMSLSHNGHSQFSDSNTGERDDIWLHNGLSDLGREAVALMNQYGIMIDVSHPSKAANMATMELSRAPVIASHSSARALNDHSRNLDDEELMALKANGGVVHTVAFRSYVNADKNAAYRSAVDSVGSEMAAEMGVEPVNVADFVDHIDYMVDLIGIDHVGISSDFDGGGGVDGWMDASETFNVTLELVRRGYTEDEIGKLWSGNLLRVLDDVQRIAAEIQAEM